MTSERMPGSHTTLTAAADTSRRLTEAEWKQKLSPVQYRVLREKATDSPGEGKYDNFYEKDGTYVCAGCRTPLYTAYMKFKCGCGWPGFWDCLPQAVREVPDSDGRRVEIICNACEGHLGHVFRGEAFNNPLNERHCVNSTSIEFIQGLEVQK